MDELEKLERDIKLVYDSVVHWLDSLKDPVGFNCLSSGCPLCRVYGCGVCLGCPIMEKTRKCGCGGTPWLNFSQFPTVANGQQEIQFLQNLYAELCEKRRNWKPPKVEEKIEKWEDITRKLTWGVNESHNFRESYYLCGKLDNCEVVHVYPNTSFSRCSSCPLDIKIEVCGKEEIYFRVMRKTNE